MEVEIFWGVFNFQPPELKNHGGLGKWRLKRDFFAFFDLKKNVTTLYFFKRCNGYSKKAKSTYI
jgi:hypothetical protein